MPTNFLPPVQTPLTPKEKDMAANIIRIMKVKMEHDYKVGSTLRDAHPKGHAVLKARFTVRPLVDPALRVGLFAKPGEHDAVVRLSSASSDVQPDSVPDVRGFAIKLPKLNQDFVLISAPTMPLGTVQLFHDAIRDQVELKSPARFFARMLFTHPLRMLELAKMPIVPRSPFAIPWYSTTPYTFGAERTCKYILRPTSAHQAPAPNKLPPSDYLTQVMREHLSEADATFEFGVQFGVQGQTLNDAGEDWSHAPVVVLADLVIPKQPVGVEGQAELVFSPAHALPPHTPLGGLNLARVDIYKALSTFRQTRDGGGGGSLSKL